VSKYGNRKTVRDGINFDSAAEADHYGKLVALLRTGYISDLRWQVSYPLVVNGVKVAVYRADFVYVDCATGRTIVEDVKGMRLPIYVMG
jgi:hypothetical protein